jgi:hypothetical protein
VSDTDAALLVVDRLLSFQPNTKSGSSLALRSRTAVWRNYDQQRELFAAVDTEACLKSSSRIPTDGRTGPRAIRRLARNGSASPSAWKYFEPEQTTNQINAEPTAP